MIPPRCLPALRIVLARLRGIAVDWVVTGSLGTVLQGLELDVHDIDLQTDKAGAYAMEDSLSDYVADSVRYVESPRMRSYLGRLEIDGVRVEIMGDIQKLLPDGTWEPPVNVVDHRRWADFEGVSVPVLSLNYEYRAYRLMGRDEQAAVLRRWLETHPDV
jgi:hypothetical protein